MKIKTLNKLIISSFLALSTFTSCQLLKEENSKEKINNEILVPYILKKDNQIDIYLTNIFGNKKVRVTNDVFEESDPIMLPNQRILFSSKRTGTWQLYTIRKDGTDIKPITKDKAVNNYRPSLSLDGSVIFVSDRDLKPKIYSMDFDGENVNLLTKEDSYFDYPSPLDDGTILYLSNQGTKWQIWKMNADGSNKQKITNMINNPISLTSLPSYIRDSQKRTPALDDSFISRRNITLNRFLSKAIFTARNKEGDLEIYRINVDGSDLRNLTKMPGLDASPRVLKNGKIVFTSDREGTYDVWVMEPDGNNPINLTREVYNARTR